MTNESQETASLLERAEHHIYLAAGYILILAAAGLLLAAVIEVAKHMLTGDYAAAIVSLLDRVLLALMIAEITYTVVRITRTQRLETEPFLIVGIIAAVRRILVITAEGVSHMNLSDPAFQAVLAELGLLTLIIFLLAWAIRLVKAPTNRGDMDLS